MPIKKKTKAKGSGKKASDTKKPVAKKGASEKKSTASKKTAKKSATKKKTFAKKKSTAKSRRKKPSTGSVTAARPSGDNADKETRSPQSPLSSLLHDYEPDAMADGNAQADIEHVEMLVFNI
ncbi:MAG: hypothetical protein KAR83_10275, partial [Thermodesulfovibrionales bacterium]|nr:hypothetical protein [Thermodesulfovibrionales bacterium]